MALPRWCWPWHDITAESCWRWHRRGDIIAESYWRRCCQVMLAMSLPRWLGRGVMSPSSHASNGAAKSCWWWQCQSDLAVARCCCRVMLTMMLPSHVGNGVAEVTWSWHDITIESCWRWCCWVMLAMTLSSDFVVAPCRWRVMIVMMLPSHAGDDTATQGCTAYSKVVQPPSSEHQGVVVEWRSRIDMLMIADICVGA
jgi:hypothetical protein